MEFPAELKYTDTDEWVRVEDELATIGVTDLDASRAFYEDVVGCTYWRQNDTTVALTSPAQKMSLPQSRGLLPEAAAVDIMG